MNFGCQTFDLNLWQWLYEDFWPNRRLAGIPFGSNCSPFPSRRPIYSRPRTGGRGSPSQRALASHVRARFKTHLLICLSKLFFVVVVMVAVTPQNTTAFSFPPSSSGFFFFYFSKAPETTVRPGTNRIPTPTFLRWLSLLHVSMAPRFISSPFSTS